MKTFEYIETANGNESHKESFKALTWLEAHLIVKAMTKQKRLNWAFYGKPVSFAETTWHCEGMAMTSSLKIIERGI